MESIKKVARGALRFWPLLLILLVFVASRVRQSDANPYTASPAGFQQLETSAPVPATGAVDVVDFFYYGCPHCTAFEPQLEAWIASQGSHIHVRRVPFAPDDERVRQAHMYYALVKMGQADRLQGSVFAEIHQHGDPLDTDQRILDWVARQGVDIDAFKQAYFSPEVEAQRVAGMDEIDREKIAVVPTVVIGGKWVINAQTAGDLNKAIAVMSQRVAASAQAPRTVADAGTATAR
jgi:thiol:disulfide interchange protein DsbA